QLTLRANDTRVTLEMGDTGSISTSVIRLSGQGSSFEIRGGSIDGLITTGLRSQHQEPESVSITNALLDSARLGEIQVNGGLVEVRPSARDIIGADGAAISTNGGNIILRADQGSVSVGTIDTRKNLASESGDAGDVYIQSLVSVSVNGDINASGTDATSTQPAGNAGTVHIQSTYITVAGSIIAHGGSSLFGGPSGSGGTLVITTSNDNPNQFYVGSADIGGFVDLRGGYGSGQGGSLLVDSGTFRVAGVDSNGVSIDASGGDLSSVQSG